ncbi:hypothetical protein [Achromobacter sp. DH1f]|uniref:hypothetical protein n=1 Tax=Achromobacter sp. DH1f TaxID=1397275 RepID=UPI000469C3AD|nr:hypothetical protein [Achromobacter sp. DH1f]
MPAGLQVFGDEGQVQIDGSSPHITLLRKGTVVSEAEYGATQTNTSFAYIGVMPNEILAFRPAGGQYGNVFGRNGNTVTMIVTGGRTPIDYWVFSRHVPSGLNYGMQLFDENETMIYDTGRAVMNVLGTHDGTGGPVAWSAQGVALIPWQTYAGIERRIEYLPAGALGSPDYMMFIISTLGIAAISGNMTYSTNSPIAANAAGPYSGSGVGAPSGWTYIGNNGVDNRFMVISTDNL